jgi:hypothetical protein
MRRVTAVLMIVLAAGGFGYAVQWIWLRIVLVFVFFALGLLYPDGRR